MSNQENLVLNQKIVVLVVHIVFLENVFASADSKTSTEYAKNLKKCYLVDVAKMVMNVLATVIVKIKSVLVYDQEFFEVVDVKFYKKFQSEKFVDLVIFVLAVQFAFQTFVNVLEMKFFLVEIV